MGTGKHIDQQTVSCNGPLPRYIYTDEFVQPLIQFSEIIIIYITVLLQ